MLQSLSALKNESPYAQAGSITCIGVPYLSYRKVIQNGETRIRT